jgi:hypothetical protein
LQAGNKSFGHGEERFYESKGLVPDLAGSFWLLRANKY